MRRILRNCFAVLALAVMSSPAWAQGDLSTQPPMDLGADHAGTIRTVSMNLANPPHVINWWFDAGMSYPIGELQDANIDPGLLLRVNNVVWRRDALGLVGSLG